ncbi:hypothetical protein TCAL_10417 [Tigriopus californicus]|uniref:Uncharacterized protein n=1 Tax=Tigriopus californicus TaxID=6832 RepID=A0A553PL39_TIGCA|nr:hypothetical protein TCAL_10417 [Tigriopus californicus]
MDQHYRQKLFSTRAKLSSAEEDLLSTKDTPKMRKIEICNKRNLVLTIKVAIVITCTVLLFVQSEKCFKRYFQYDTTATLSVKPTGEATFLAFSICPAFEAAYKNDVLDNYGITEKNYQKGIYTPTINPENKSHEDIFNEATYTLEEILMEIKLKTSNQSWTEVAVPFKFEEWDNEIAAWDTNYHQLYGKCYTMSLQPDIAQMEVTQVQVESKINIFVFLHHPGQFNDFNSKTKMHSILGKSLFIDITYEITVNTLGEESEIPCATEMDYAFDNCMSQEVVGKLVTRHGCSLPYLPSKSGSTICNPTNIELREAAFKDYDFFTSNGQKQLCDRPCSTMEVFSGLPVSGVTDDGLAQMKMYPCVGSVVWTLASQGLN